MTLSPSHLHRHGHSWRDFIGLKLLVIVITLFAGLLVAHGHSSAASPISTPFPIGTADTSDTSDTSGYTLPAANALAGYSLSYATTFTGSTLPTGWDTYNSVPGGDPGAMFSSSAVTVANNLLTLNASQNPTINPSAAGGNWITGGLCLCAILGQVNGAYFYRARVTGAGPSTVGLLWPDTNTWPPEIDFNETPSGGTGQSTATVHIGPSNQILLTQISIDMTQWHTWGVVWTPSRIVFTVDGEIWGVDDNVASIPNVAMHLSIQQQTFCGATPVHACPTSDQSTQVDWVAQYTPDTTSTTTSTTTVTTTTVSTSSTTTTGPGATPTNWSSVSSASSLNATSSTNISFPSLSASSPGQLYVGYGYASTSGTTTADANTTFINTSGGKNIFVDNPDVTGTLSPVTGETPSGTSATVGAIISAPGIVSGVISPVGSLLHAGGLGSSDALEFTPQNVGDALVIGVRIGSATDSVASVSSGNAKWHFLANVHDVTNGQVVELWWGVVTASQSSPIVVALQTPNNSISFDVQEFQVTSATNTTSTTSTTLSNSTGTTLASATSTTTTSPLPGPASTTTSSQPVGPLRGHGVVRLASPVINGRQVRISWSDQGVHVLRIWGEMYSNARCTQVVHTQVVPNAVDAIANGEIHFSKARGGSPRFGSFSPMILYYVRIVAVLTSPPQIARSACVKIGRG